MLGTGIQTARAVPDAAIAEDLGVPVATTVLTVMQAPSAGIVMPEFAPASVADRCCEHRLYEG